MAPRLHWRPGMNQQALTVVEPALFQSQGGLFLSKRRMVFATIELTATHLVVYRKSMLWLFFGAIGALLSRGARGKRALELPVASIASVARGKYGFNKKILDVTMTDGKTHRISIERFDELCTQLRAQLGAGVKFAA